MELLAAAFMVGVFVSVSYFFKYTNLTVTNYLGKQVSYSIGTIIVILFSIDFFFYRSFSLGVMDYLFVSFLWIIGMIDDRFGTTYPKGIKGHLSMFLNQKKITTGLFKAGGGIIVSLFYVIGNNVQGQGIPIPIFLLLLIFLPHAINLLDTKPLRVFKVVLLLLFTPFVIYGLLSPSQIHLLLVLFVLWAISEVTMVGMLGDNGAMVIGGIWAISAFKMDFLYYPISILVFVLSITLISERVSIQGWVEKTPIIRQFDRLGRLE